jgi:inositol-1,4,5-trisphosphate 5-phosphatase
MVYFSPSPLPPRYLFSEGLPARARIQPPSNDHIPNPNRPSNPFTPSPEPDWVEINKLGTRPEPPPARGSQRARTVDFNNPATFTSASSSTTSLQSQNPMARKMIVPQYNARDPEQITYMDGAHDPVSDLRRNASNASTRSLPILPNRNLPPVTSSLPGPPLPMNSKPAPQVLRKPGPPPVKPKPSLLSKGSSSGATPPPQRYRDDPEPAPRRSMAPPPNMGARKPVPNLMDGDDRPPALPPRTGTGLSTGSGRRGNLLDDEGDLRGLDGWEVLKPDR